MSKKAIIFGLCGLLFYLIVFGISTYCTNINNSIETVVVQEGAHITTTIKKTKIEKDNFCQMFNFYDIFHQIGLIVIFYLSIISIICGTFKDLAKKVVSLLFIFAKKYLKK